MYITYFDYIPVLPPPIFYFYVFREQVVGAAARLGPSEPRLRRAGREQAAGHLPLEAVALVQGAQGCIWILVMEVDRGSHEQEGSIGHVHTPAHLTVQLHHNGIPARRCCSGRLRQELASALGQ